MRLDVERDPSGLLRDVVSGTSTGVACVERHRALLRGHFALQSGAHAGYFLRFAKIGWDETDCGAIAAALCATPRPGRLTRGRIVVFSPESAGFFLGRALARVLGATHAIAMVDKNRCPIDRFRSERVLEGDRVVVVNDVVTSSGSLDGLRAMAARHGGEVVAARVFATLATDAFARWSATHRLDGRHLVEASWPTYPASRCPLCERGDAPIPAIEFN